MSEKIVITGATGAIGMALIQKCIREEAEVLVLSHKGSPRNSRLPKHPLIQVVPADLDHLAEIDYYPEKGYNIFYHLAWKGTYGDARNDLRLQLQNVQSAIDAVELAARLGCYTFVGVGSQAEYGRGEGVMYPDTPAFPENGYGMAKLCAGQMSRVLCGQKGMRHVWARIFSVYGPYDRAETMVSGCLRKMLRGEPTAFTPGGQIWDFLYSEDAADALWRLGRNGRDGQVYCVGSGEGKPLKEYILEMQRLTGYGREVGLAALPYASGQVMELCADISKLTADTGFLPGTTFADGIRKTIDWIRKDEKDQYRDTML